MAKTTWQQTIVATFAKDTRFSTMPGILHSKLVDAAKRMGLREETPARFRLRYKRACECQKPEEDVLDPKVPTYEGVITGQVKDVHMEATHRGCTGRTLLAVQCLGRAM